MTKQALMKRINADIAACGSQSKYAQLVGVSRVYICQMLRGDYGPGPKILKYYGLKAKPLEFVEVNGKSK